MSDREREELVEAALDSLPALEPESGFADRVMQAKVGDEDVDPGLASRISRTTGHPMVRLAAVGVVAACGLLTWHALRGGPSGPITGELIADSRQTVELGRRAVAVAEPGADVSWSIAGPKSARVEQKRGNVFYRVDKGGTFEVVTPRGTVTITGTCFRVEIEEMKSKREAVKGAVVGAALAATVVVTVYEGGVLFADSGGQSVPVQAGERIAISDRGVTRGRASEGEEGESVAAVALKPPADDATRDELLVRDEAQRQEISRLRKQLDGVKVVRRGGPRDKVDADGRPWFDPSKDTLTQFAAECRVRYDLPPFDMGQEVLPLPDEALEAISITSDERARMEKAYLAVRESLTHDVRQLYIEATGDTAGAEALSMSAMGQELQHKSSRGATGLIHQRIAQERAGLAKPPTDLSQRSPLERYYRLLGHAGDATENAFAEVLGAKRAHELRTEMGGWGARMEYAGCADEKDEDVER